MIVGIQGVLTHLETDRLHLAHPSGLTFEALVPGYTITRLGASVGQTIQLSTLTFLESQNQGNSFVPRLAGFLTAQDKAFFELLVTVKGIGNRKALRAMAMPCHQIAHAIADRDAKTLQALPEIGKRSAETIILDLKNKIDPFLTPAPAPGSGASEQPGTVEAGAASKSKSKSTQANATKETPSDAQAAPAPTSGGGLAREAVQTLVALGENPIQAGQWVDHVLQQKSPPTEVGGLVAQAFQVKAGAGQG